MTDFCDTQINMFIYFCQQNYNGDSIDIKQHIQPENVQEIRKFLDYMFKYL